jgi:hypothetical protein
MNEAEWFGCTSLMRMLESSHLKMSERKRRLFGCACVRRVWHLLSDKRGRKAIETTERYVDGSSNSQALHAASGEANWAAQHAHELAHLALRAAATIAHARTIGRPDILTDTLRDVASLTRCASDKGEAEPLAQVWLLHDVVGNPFRPVGLDLACRTPNVLALAVAVYEERTMPAGTLDNARLAVLADALEDAGCTDAAILDHLRGPGPHVRGCFAVDLILGKS